jgi:hypothetical protein
MMPPLPPEFADLQPFAEQWCLETEPERYEMRLAAPMPDLVAFYDAVVPRAEAAMAYCDQFHYPDLPENALNLLHLLYSMIMVSFPVEAWGQQRVPDTGSASFDCFVEPVP